MINPMKWTFLPLLQLFLLHVKPPFEGQQQQELSALGMSS